MAGLFDQQMIESRVHPAEADGDWSKRSPIGPRGRLAAPIPNMIPPDMGLMDEFITSNPGRFRGERQQINYRKRK